MVHSIKRHEDILFNILWQLISFTNQFRRIVNKKLKTKIDENRKAGAMKFLNVVKFVLIWLFNNENKIDS